LTANGFIEGKELDGFLHEFLATVMNLPNAEVSLLIRAFVSTCTISTSKENDFNDNDERE
jgi:hypothetical protein